MKFLERAIPLAERRFRVFPLIPKTKRPVKLSEGDHFDAATDELESLQRWNAKEPNANVGITPDENFCFLETDDEAALKEACANVPIEAWDTARVSARENRCYYIFRQTSRTRRVGNMTATRPGEDNLFEFKQHRVYVTGPGSIHPKTGSPYVVEWRTIPAMPDVLLNRLAELYGVPKPTDNRRMSEETLREIELLERFLDTYEVATTGDWFNKGKQWFRAIECPWVDEHENTNGGSSTCIVYTEGGGYGFDCKHRCSTKTWKDFRAELERRFPGRKFSFVESPEVGFKTQARVVAGTTQKPQEGTSERDWRAGYHTLDEIENAPPVSFIVDGFLTLDGVTALAAPVAQRKSLIALNVVHAACTGEALFGKFEVISQPQHVLYLCPEMGLHSFSERLRKIGLLSYVGKTLFCRTMASDGSPTLDDMVADELKGALVVVDTAVRYLEGDENSSEDMRKFAASVFRLLKDGAVSVLLLHHSGKGTKETGELSLENAMRGSGELGAFVASCWATRLQDPSEPYKSASYLVNVKQRDFASKPFEVTSGEDGRLHYVETDGEVRLQSRGAFRGNKDGKDDAAIALLRAKPELSIRDAVSLLAESGIKRGRDWVHRRKCEVRALAQRCPNNSAMTGRRPKPICTHHPKGVCW